MDKTWDSAESMWAGNADKELDSNLSDLEKDLASGNFPLGDPAAFDAWLANYARRISDSQGNGVRGTGSGWNGTELRPV